MGVLKHVVFPLMTLMFAHNALRFFILQDAGEMMSQAGWTPLSDPPTMWEQKTLDMIGGGSLSGLVTCVAGFLYEDGHFRAVVAAGWLISFAIDAGLSHQRGYPWGFSAGMAAIIAAGLAAHAFEPGFLTKDKAGKSKAK